MARINYVRRGYKRKKKWGQFKILTKKAIFISSISANLYVVTKYAYENEYLTNIIEIYTTKIAPIMESLIALLPL